MLVGLGGLGGLAPALAQPATPYQQDLDALCRFVADEYAYFDQRPVRWDAACAALRPEAGNVPDLMGFTNLLERLIAELADPHAFIGSSNARSPRLVPTSTDVLARWQGDAAAIEHVREGSAAERAGVRAGQRVLAIDGVPLAEAVQRLQARHWPAPAGGSAPEARHAALQQALAGLQNDHPVRLSLVDGRSGSVREVSVLPGIARPNAAATFEVITTPQGQRIGWVRVHNSLGDSSLIPAWDAAIDALADTEGLVVDLRDTPSGGNTTVARALMGRLVSAPAPYQQHELVAESRRHGVRRVWVEWVMPRGRTYTRPVVVLVGPWTGSMGEGTAIGLNAVRGAPVLGPPMAGLLGGLGSITLANSRLTVKVPTEKLNHVDGTPREAWRPCPLQALAVVASGGRAVRTAAGALEDVAVLNALAALGRSGADELRMRCGVAAGGTAKAGGAGGGVAGGQLRK